MQLLNVSFGCRTGLCSFINGKDATECAKCGDRLSVAWPVVPEGYVVGEELGSGSFAKVYGASCTVRDGERCAIKVMELDDIPKLERLW